MANVIDDIKDFTSDASSVISSVKDIASSLKGKNVTITPTIGVGVDQANIQVSASEVIKGLVPYFVVGTLIILLIVLLFVRRGT